MSTVSVVVVTWNGAHLLPANVDSLLAQEGLDGPLEIVVVDNGSVDGTLDLLRQQYPDVSVVALGTNTGFAAGANAGIGASTGDVVVLLNNDAVAEPGFVAAAVGTLDSDPRLGAVTGLIVLSGGYSRTDAAGAEGLEARDGSHWIRNDMGTVLVNSTGGEVTTSANGRDRDWLVPVGDLSRASGPVPGFSGGAAALRRSALDEVGLFDERLFMYYEDSDLSWRLRRAGWGIGFERDAVVVHQHAASSGTASDFFLFHNERNRVLFAVKHGTPRIIATALYRSLGSWVKAVRRGDRASAARKARAFGSALRLMPGFHSTRVALNRGAQVSAAHVWVGAPRD